MTTIRAATDDDGDGLLLVLAGVFAEYPPTLFDRSEFPELARPSSAFVAQRGELWVVEDRGEIVGSCGYVMTEDPATAELRKLYLTRRVRGRGLARELVELAEGAARARGARRMQLFSDVRFEAAHGLYAHLGYVRRPRTKALGDLSSTIEAYFDKDWTS